MRTGLQLLCAAALCLSAPAQAADALKFGPSPPWVVPVTIPSAPTTLANAPVLVLLKDEQARLEAGKMTTFTELALKI